MNIFKSLYDKTIALSEKPYAVKALGAVSFAESSFFPIPPDVILLPMSLAKPHKALYYAAVCTITSVLGGILGYYIGAVLYDTAGAWVINFYGLQGKAETFREQFQQHGHWIILLKGLTPIPFKLVTITSGLAGYDIWMFILLSIITRGGRFFILAGVLHKYGDVLRVFIEKHLTALAIGTIIAIVGGFVAVKYLV
jgi:membrane protein YqaA with SNARE-associated domain